ncbi:T9SS type B sorting domain-containing protein [Aquimarina celericrescens]|uniref:T9SS type B sorting domain-containing protein n=1 Tax=Aquimarina celericrescens TaxID=1964542 RepID=A0ABW5AU57_9FLAO|nr:T9SS type B sorting domain-containing protein [Aquimarina celericrescens]
MKPMIYPRCILVLFAMLLLGFGEVYSQNIATPDPIAVVFDTVPGSVQRIRGELKMIANAIVGPNDRLENEFGNDQNYTPNDDYNGPETNNRKTFGYIDIDGDPSTFSSSSADLTVSDANCAEVVYAGLYWAASYYVDRTNSTGSQSTGSYPRYRNLPFPDNRPDFRTLKFKPAWSASYIDILPSRTEVLYDGYRNTATNPSDIAIRDIPYACYADVTDIFNSKPAAASVDGTYTIADMRASTGTAGRNSAGISGGWVLVVIYEDPALSSKFISTNKGFLEVSADNSAQSNKTFTYTGFQTLPPPLDVRARYGLATLEGDFDLRGDQLLLRRPNNAEYALRTTPANPFNNFFDSSISVDGNYVDRPERIPASRNTLGFDSDIFDIPNQTNGQNWLIGNDQTEVNFRVTTSSDRFRIFMNSFQVEIIEPELRVTKRVIDRATGNDITEPPNNSVNLGQELFYELTIQNIGNEDIINASIRDVLPDNINFTDFALITADPGVTWNYDSTAREFTITLDDNVVQRFDGPVSMRFGVEVVANCAELRDACSDQISNVAFATYTGDESGITRSGEPSGLGPDACNFDIAEATLVLADLGSCTGDFDRFLCTGDLPLTAGGGFDTYEWRDITSGLPGTVIGTTQTINVTSAGRYQVTKVSSICADGVETYNVSTLGEINHPIVTGINNGSIPNGQVETCSITGDAFPEIYLCGASASVLLDSNFGDNVVWERLDPAACPSVTRVDSCPTTNSGCDSSWVQVGAGQTFTLDQAGEYRLTAIFDNNCPRTFYFNAFQNNFDPQLQIVREIICGTPGTLTVQNSSSQYEYQLVVPGGTILPSAGNYQASPTFTGLTVQGNYTVNVRQNNGEPTACVFQASQFMEDQQSDIRVEKTDPVCADDEGEIRITIIDAEPTYIYNISSADAGNSFSDSFGPTTDVNHEFTGLNPGLYDIEVLSYDEDGVGAAVGCIDTDQIRIEEPADFEAAAVLNRDLACNPRYQPDPSLPFFDDNEFIALVEINIITGGSGSYGYSASSDGGTTFVPLDLDPQTPPVTNIFRLYAAGTYIIQVTDTNTGCIVDAGTVIVTPFEQLDGSATPSTLNCPNDPGSITVNLTAGEGPFTYVLNGTDTIGPSNNTTEIFNGVDTTITHEVVVTDNFGCDITFSNIQFTAPTPITATATPTEDLRCDAAGTAVILGQITVTGAANGNGSYEYSIDGFTTFNTTGVFNNLTAGTYTVEIRDTNTAACPVNLGDITIDPLQEVNGLSFTEGPITCPSLTSAITVAATGTNGATSFEYRVATLPPAQPGYDVFSSNDTYTLPQGGTYTFEARTTVDGCVYSDTYTVSTIQNIAVTGNMVSQPICNGDTNGSLQFTVSNIDLAGGDTYSYNIDGGTEITGQSAPSITETGLGAGTYRINVTDETTNCTNFVDIEITQPDPLGFTFATSIADCNAANGTITVNATGGRGGYQYRLLDDTGVELVAFQNNNIFTGLAGGTPPTPITYRVEVRDSNDPATACVTPFQNVDLFQAPPIVITAVSGGDQCYTSADPATQWIEIAGGVGPFTYSLDGGAPQAVTLLGAPPNTFEIPNLTPRNAGTVPPNYSVTVSDTNGCSSNTVTFEVQEELIVTATRLKNLTCDVGNEAARIDLAVTGGNGVTSLEVSFNAGIFTSYTGPIPFTTLNPGTYQFRVTDSASPTACTDLSEIITIDPAPAPAVLAPTVTNVSCPGLTDGSVTVNVDTSVGTPPFLISFNGSAFTSQTTYGNLAGSPAGTTYNYIVRDDKNCEANFSATVFAPEPFNFSKQEFDISCNSGVGNIPGRVEYTAISGGTPPYTYSLRNLDNTLATTTSTNPDGPTASTAVTFDGLEFGDYIFRIVDANGCIFEDTVDIANPASFTVTPTASPTDCVGGVTISINISGGTGPFFIREVTPGGTEPFVAVNTPPRDHILLNQPYDTPFTFEILDQTTNCTEIGVIPIVSNPSGLAITGTETDVQCFGANDGTFPYTVTGYSGNELTYAIYRTNDLTTEITGSYTFNNPPFNSNVETGLTGAPSNGIVEDFGPGEYLLRVTETDGGVVGPCNAAIVFTIDEPSELQFNVGTPTIANCNAPSQVTVSGSGGTPPYRYAAVVDGTAPVAGDYGTSNVLTLDPGAGPAFDLDWDIYILDANDCTVPLIDVTITRTADPLFEVPFPTLVDNSCTTNNSLTVLATGSSQLTFGRDDGDTSTADSPVTGLGTPTGNPNEYTFTYTFPGPSVDQYTLTVTDVNGCDDTQTIIVYPELRIDANFIAPDPTCLDADGTIEVTVTGGSDFSANPGNFTFTLTGTDSNGNPVNRTQGGLATDNIFTLVSAGNYTVEVRDSAIGPAIPAPGGCAVTDDVSRPVPIEPILDPPIISGVQCVGDSNGSILVNIQPGTDTDGPFTYELWQGPTGTGTLLFSQPGDPLFDNLADISAVAPPNNVYGIRVVSDSGCEDAIENITVPSPPAFTASRIPSNYSCDPSNNDVFPDITVDIVGGTSPYTITYTGPVPLAGTNLPVVDASGTPTNQFIIDADQPGTYVISVFDNNGCRFDLPDVIIDPFPIMTNPTIVEDTAITCPTGTEIITVSITGGTDGGSFLFEEVNGAVASQIVTYENGNTAGSTITSFDFNLPGVGNYTFRITDQTTTCSIATPSYNVAPFDLIEADARVTQNVACFGDTTGEITVDITNYTYTDGTTGIGGYDYTVTNTSTSTVFTTGSDTGSPLVIPNVPAGTYVINIVETDINSTLCDDDSQEVRILQPATPVTIDSLTERRSETCNPGDDAEIEVVAIGGTPPYQYQLESEDSGGIITVLVPFQTTTTVFSGLDANNGTTSALYRVRVLDANSCPVDQTIVINPPTPISVAAPSPILLQCADSRDGSITATVTGGQGPGLYQFRITLPDGTQSGPVTSDPATPTVYTWNDLGPGNYIITVSDNLNCEDTANVTINAPTPVLVNVDPSGESCFTANPNRIEVTGSGGTPGYTYFYVNTSGVEIFEPTGIFTNLPQGDYQFFARDANGCDSPASNNIQVRDVMPLTVVLDEGNFNIVCFSEATASVDAIVTGGLGGYTYRVEGTDYLGILVNLPGPLNTNTQDVSFFDGLSEGNYEYIVTSGDCNEVRTPFTIVQPPEFLAEAFEEPISCSGETDGRIRVTATGGTAPYFYSLYDGNDDQVFLFIEDDVDGTPGEHIFENLAADSYRVEVEDSFGCPVTIQPIEILEPDPIDVLEPINTTPEECAGDMNGTATIAIIGGLPPVDPADPAYFWSRDGISYLPVTNPTNLFIDNLAGGTTTIFIRDSRNNPDCELPYNIEIEPGPLLDAELVASLECPVYDYSDPMNPVLTQDERYFIDFNIVPESETLDIIYTLNGINGTPNPPNNSNLTGRFEVSPGEYEGVMESALCIRTVDTIQVEEYTPLDIPVLLMTNNPQDPNEYEIIVTGGTRLDREPFYIFEVGRLEDGQSITDVVYDINVDGNIFVIRETATYVVRVTDANGCQAITVQELTYINIRIPNYFTPNDPNSTPEERFWYPRQITPNIDDPFFFEDMEVKIFDRYGRMLGEFRGDQQGWSGVYQGKELPSGDYWFTIILNDVDSREFTGHFTLYR